MSDISFHEALRRAENALNEGAEVHQKFTCERCDKRLTIEKPDVFYTRGQCECGHITDLELQGCGFLVVFGRCII